MDGTVLGMAQSTGKKGELLMGAWTVEEFQGAATYCGREAGSGCSAEAAATLELTRVVAQLGALLAERLPEPVTVECVTPVAEAPKGAAWDLWAALVARIRSFSRDGQFIAYLDPGEAHEAILAWLDGAKEPPR